MSTSVHPTAIISPGAQLDAGVSIGAFCIVGPKVRIGSGTKLHSHVVIEGNTSIGAGCEIYPFACLGQPPQDFKYKDEDTRVVIGERNIIREGVTVHRASISGDGETSVGSDNYLMANVHIAHDCKIGSHVIMASFAGLSGHVTIEDHVVLGGLAGVHQYVRIGAYSMIGGLSRIVQDVAPFMLCSGNDKAKLHGLNLVGLKRKGFTDEDLTLLKKAYKELFRGKPASFAEAQENVQQEMGSNQHVQYLLKFVRESARGLCR